ncbi:MAG: DoxX family protein [Burkholderiales bacterium]|nr:DoxX family protein [Burkholderiales bacterium]
MSDDAGKLVLRLTLGLLMLLHGIAKLRTGVSGIEGMLEGNGLPGFIAYGVYVGEVLAPLMLILGFHARTGAVLIAVNMLFAIGLAHPGDVAALSRTGGWAIELQAFFLFTAVAVALLGPGRYAINRR